MTFRKFDAGALDRPKGAPKEDCQVRALATARNIPYEDAWALLYLVQGELRRCAFALVESLTANDPRFGVKRALAFPAAKGKPRMTGAAFCMRYPRGRYILRTSHHVVAVKDGVLYDTFDSSTKCVYTAWELSPSCTWRGGRARCRQREEGQPPTFLLQRVLTDPSAGSVNGLAPGPYWINDPAFARGGSLPYVWRYRSS